MGIVGRALVCAVVGLAVLEAGVRGEEGPATGPASSPATAASRPALQAEVDAIVPRLSGGSFREREEATRAIKALGPTAAPAIQRAAEAATDTEAKSRLLGVIDDMAEAEATHPTLITLDVKESSLREVFESLSKQAGVKVVGWPDQNMSRGAGITLKCEGKPFWAVIDEIRKQQPLALMGGNEEGRIQFHVGAGGRGRGPAMMTGPLMVGLNSITRTYQVDFANDTGEGSEPRVSKQFQASFDCMVDPRIHCLQDSMKVQLMEAKDEKGTSLMPEGRGGVQSAHLWGYTTNWSLPLEYPANPGARIKVLKGTVKVDVVTRTETIEFKDLKAGGSKALGGMTVTLKECKLENQYYNVAMKFERGLMPKDQWERMWDQSNGALVELINEKGESFPRSGYGGGGTVFTRDYTYNFSARNNTDNNLLGKAAVLRMSMPTKTKTLELPFEFKDLPLP